MLTITKIIGVVLKKRCMLTLSVFYKNEISPLMLSNNVSQKYFSALGVDFTKRIKKDKHTTFIRSHILHKRLQSQSKVSKLEKPDLNCINDPNLGLTYTKIEKNSTLLSKVLLAARNRNNSEIIIEGKRLFLEAISCGVELKTVIFSQKRELSLVKDELLKLPKFEIYRVPHHNLKLWSTLTTQPGLLGIFTRPNTSLKQLQNLQYVPITVICDNIREPNNLGSIIRICAALPCSKIIVLKGCCDPWESKALRSGCGGHFRINIETNCKWEDLSVHLPIESSVFIADSNIRKMKERYVNIKKFSEITISNNNFLIIGGETHGISEEAYNLVKCRGGTGIHIPLANDIDSLNVASALSLILFTLRQNVLTDI